MNTSSSILIVDDEPNNFDVLQFLLSKQDYLLYYASTGLKAINMLESVQPDLQQIQI